MNAAGSPWHPSCPPQHCVHGKMWPSFGCHLFRPWAVPRPALFLNKPHVSQQGFAMNNTSLAHRVLELLCKFLKNMNWKASQLSLPPSPRGGCLCMGDFHHVPFARGGRICDCACSFLGRGFKAAFSEVPAATQSLPRPPPIASCFWKGERLDRKPPCPESLLPCSSLKERPSVLPGLRPRRLRLL